MILCPTFRYANVTIGLPCILKRTTYTGYNRDNTPYNVTVSRDNCLSSKPKLYCSSTTNICEKMKNLGSICSDSSECYSVSIQITRASTPCKVTETINQRYCSSSGRVCSEPPGRPMKLERWHYALTVVSVLAGESYFNVFTSLAEYIRTAMSAIVVFLVLGHKRQRMERYYELLDYYHEQTR